MIKNDFFFYTPTTLLVDLEKFQPWAPDSIRLIIVNFEVLKLLHLIMDCQEVCFK